MSIQELEARILAEDLQLLKEWDRDLRGGDWPKYVNGKFVRRMIQRLETKGG